MGFANGYQTTTTGSLTSGATSVTVASTTGIPALPFTATIAAEGANTDEIVLVTANAAGTLTLTRGYELFAGNGASAHASGATIAAVVTSGFVSTFVTTAQTDTLGGTVIPDLIGSPDRLPTSPNAADVEFNVASGTVLGTLDINNVTDFPSHWHGKRTTAGVEVNGLYWTIPSLPCTITAKFSALRLYSGYPSVGIMLLDSGPTAIREFSYNFAAGTTVSFSLRRYTNRTTFSTSIDTNTGMTDLNFWTRRPIWLRLLVTSSSSVTFSYSFDGFIYENVPSIIAVSPTITPAFFGICLTDPIGVGVTEGLVGSVRVT